MKPNCNFLNIFLKLIQFYYFKLDYIENNVYLWKIRQESKLKDTEINFYEGVEFEEG